MSPQIPEIPECEVCGCTEFDPCTTPHGPCHWIRPGLCSACAAVLGEPLLVLPGTPEYQDTLDAISA